MIKTRPREIPMHDAAHNLRDEKEKGPKPTKKPTKPKPHRRGRSKR